MLDVGISGNTSRKPKSVSQLAETRTGTVTNVTCESCSTTSVEGSKFCSNCGASMNYMRPKSVPLDDRDELSGEGRSINSGKQVMKVSGLVGFIVILGIALLAAAAGNSRNTLDSPLTTFSSPGTAANEVDSAPVETIGQENAREKAEVYLSVGGFSKKGLVEQLKYEGFTNEDAAYAVDNIVVDWQEQAARKAETYMSVQAFSEKGLIAQLEYEGFTKVEAAYGAYAVGFRP